MPDEQSRTASPANPPRKRNTDRTELLAVDGQPPVSLPAPRLRLDVLTLAVALEAVDRQYERGWTPAQYARAISDEYERANPQHIEPLAVMVGAFARDFVPPERRMDAVDRLYVLLREARLAWPVREGRRTAPRGADVTDSPPVAPRK